MQSDSKDVRLPGGMPSLELNDFQDLYAYEFPHRTLQCICNFMNWQQGTCTYIWMHLHILLDFSEEIWVVLAWCKSGGHCCTVAKECTVVSWVIWIVAALLYLLSSQNSLHFSIHTATKSGCHFSFERLILFAKHHICFVLVIKINKSWNRIHSDKFRF